jgi:hypothetical protein
VGEGVNPPSANPPPSPKGGSVRGRVHHRGDGRDDKDRISESPENCLTIWLLFPVRGFPFTCIEYFRQLMNLLRERVANPLGTWQDAGTWLDIYDDELQKWHEDDEAPSGTGI